MTVDPNRLLRLLADIEAALTRLSAGPSVREIGSQIRSGGGFASMPPGDLRLLDLLDARSRQAALPLLTSWACNVRDDRLREGTADAGPPDGSLVAVCAYLRAAAVYVARRPWAGECEAEWSTLRSALAAMPGSPLWREVVERVECIAVVHDVKGGRECLGIIETRIVDAGPRTVHVTSRCDTCGRVYDDLAIVRAQLAQEEAVNVVTSAVAIERLAGHGLVVTPTQIRHWSSRGALTSYGKIGREQTYHLTEVARLARRRQDLAS